MLLQLLLLSSSLASGQQQQPEPVFCNLTQPGGPAGPGLDCAFPFLFYGRSYDRCTVVGEGDRRPWCPTKLDSSGVYDFGSNDWSYCDPACPFIDNDGSVSQATTAKPKANPSFRKDRVTTTKPALVFKPPTKPTAEPTTLDPLSLAAVNPGTHSGLWLPTV